MPAMHADSGTLACIGGADGCVPNCVEANRPPVNVEIAKSCTQEHVAPPLPTLRMCDLACQNSARKHLTLVAE